MGEHRGQADAREVSRRSSTSRKNGDKFPWVLSKLSAPLCSEPESNSLTKTGAGKAFGFEGRDIQSENSLVAFSLSTGVAGAFIVTHGNLRLFQIDELGPYPPVHGVADPALDFPDDLPGVALAPIPVEAFSHEER
jgi:hypothetical protein